MTPMPPRTHSTTLQTSHTMKTYSFPADLTQAIVSTLAARPWSEVHGLMQAIQSEVAKQDATQPPPVQAAASADA